MLLVRRATGRRASERAGDARAGPQGGGEPRRSAASCGSFEPGDREVGDRGGGVVGDEMRYVVDVSEVHAIGVPLRIAAHTPQDLLGPGVVEVQTGPFAGRTRARYALFLELAGDPELGEPLRRQRREFERWTERIVIAVGIADPVPATRALMALCDGLL